MINRNWLLATIASDAPEQAKRYGLGLEIDAFCMAENMDDNFAESDSLVKRQLEGINFPVLHAPFAELYPCAIDPKARQLAMRRLKQAAEIAMGYDIKRMVVHSGFLPQVYFPIWFEEKSAEFWREFLQDMPEDFQLLIENVLDDDPQCLRRMLDNIGDSRAVCCLDAGHANVISQRPITEWVEILAPHLKHMHLHNNYGEYDEHNLPQDGNMDIPILLKKMDTYAPEASITLECRDGAGAAAWIRAITDGENR